MAAAAGGAPPPSPRKPFGGLKPTDELEESDTIDADTTGGVEATGSGARRKRKRPASPAITAETPSWASGSGQRFRAAREILAEPGQTFPLGAGCKKCKFRSRVCITRVGYARCASCTASNLLSSTCNPPSKAGASTVGNLPTENRRQAINRVQTLLNSLNTNLLYSSQRPRRTGGSSAQAAPASRAKPVITTDTIQNPNIWNVR